MKNVRCQAPFCPTWMRPRVIQTPHGAQIENERICGRHWRQLPVARRKAYERARKRLYSEADFGAAVRRYRLVARLWRALRAQAWRLEPTP